MDDESDSTENSVDLKRIGQYFHHNKATNVTKYVICLSNKLAVAMERDI